MTIRLLPIEAPIPRSGFIPRPHALRWRSEPEQIEPRAPGTEIYMTQKAYARANAHAHSDLENEVGGWLIGNWRSDQASGQEYIVIERCLPARYIRHGSAHLTFTQDSQLTLYDTMEEKYPEKELVGWYHTHPRMSVFLSDYDLFLHNHFFPHPYQVALVIEPHSRKAGFFIRDRDGKLEGRYYYGFHELAGQNSRSVVRWRNLTADSPLSKGEQTDENE